MTGIEQLKRRTDALAAPGPGAVQHVFLESTGFKDAAEREARRAELEKIPGNVVVLLDSVDGAHPGEPEGMIRTLWKGQ
jgi:hypothetical protein